MRISCPSCGSKMLIRTSREQSKTCRELYYLCSNAESCGASYTYLLSLNKTLTPPRKDIKQMAIEIISFLPPVERKLAIQQINKQNNHDN